MTAPRAREQSDPPSPPDRRPPRRGGGSSPCTDDVAAARQAGLARLHLTRRGLVRSTRALAAAALLTLSGALALPATAQAEVLVSNFDEVQDTTAQFYGKQAAQGFTTGRSNSNFPLTSIEVRVLGTTTGVTATATVMTSSGGAPGEVHATLSLSGTLAVGNNTFAAPANTTLAANTSYFLVLESDATSGLWVSANTSGDEAGAPGWEIADQHRRFTSELSGWSTRTGVFQIRVNGTDSGPPYVTGAEVSTDGRTIALTFSKDLDYPTNTGTLRDDAFSVTVDGTASQIAGFSGFENVVTLTMSRLIGQGNTVVVSYDQSDAGSEALEDSDNQEVADFTTGRSGVPEVDNNSTLDTTPPALTTATVSTTGTTVALTFDENVVPAVGILASALTNAFTVTVDGVERQVTGLPRSPGTRSRSRSRPRFTRARP